ncbi:hypothetical protein [Neobacillus drentensis]|uniref:hypothetical protein n=1 Tax=Neobacillus drentensis TaxID=220684 RepID=UPI002FFD72A6
MKKLFLLAFTLAFIFSFDVRALADEGHSHAPNVKQAGDNLETGSTNGQGDDATMSHGNGTDMDMDMEGMDHSSGSDMEGMDHGSGSDMEGMDMEGDSGAEAHDHHAAVVESPPNYKVLGTYGAVNMLFILIGIWNKWFRRKGDVNNGHA